jgi:hypothetical protein
MRSKLFAIVFVCASFIISGCSGSGSSAPTTATGKFIDGPVGGLTYVSGSATGKTAPDGTFTYEIGKNVKFSINGIVIGEAPAAMVMTPIQLAKSDNADANASSPEVVNMVRFLVAASSIDANGNMTIDPNKVLTPQTSQTITFLNTTSAFRNAVHDIVPGIDNVSVAEAVTHLTSSIYVQYSGPYGGTYSSPVFNIISSSTRNNGGALPSSYVVVGTWSATLNADGTVTGSTNNGDVISGSLQDGIIYSGTAGPNQWTGTLDLSTKVLSGTWAAIGGRNTGGSSTFTGSKL